MAIDTTVETWRKVTEAQECPHCAGALEQTRDDHVDQTAGIRAVGCASCGKRYAVYLDARSHGVEEISR